jgi:hypothetical protein
LLSAVFITAQVRLIPPFCLLAKLTLLVYSYALPKTEKKF